MARIMDYRHYIPDHAVITVPLLAALIAWHYFVLRDDPDNPGIEASGAPAYYEHWLYTEDIAELDIDGELDRLELDDAARDRRIREFLQARQYQRARTLLLEVAAAAALGEDQARLGDTLTLLGEVAIHQQELAAAEIYLQEALYLAMAQDNLAGTARCYQLLGQLNIRARELARRAAMTYDDLWQARNLTARGLYHGVGDTLERVIRENLEIRRYGAAADAWEALGALHDRLHDNYQAELARLEAARLFASIGRTSHVDRLLAGVDRDYIGAAQLADARRDIERHYAQYQQDQVQTSQAHDYQMLYHHYLRSGQPERAWQFRIKASQTLANTSDRAMFQRQGDIIAVLYNSNFAMARAREYLDRAGALYDQSGNPEMRAQTREMENEIF